MQESEEPLSFNEKPVKIKLGCVETPFHSLALQVLRIIFAPSLSISLLPPAIITVSFPSASSSLYSCLSTSAEVYGI